MISLVRPPRSSVGISTARNSCGYSPPTPTPKISLTPSGAIEVGNLLRHKRWRVERKQENRAPHVHTLRDRRQPGKPNHGFRARVAGRDMATDPERIELPRFQVTRLSPLPGRDDANPEVAFAFFQRNPPFETSMRIGLRLTSCQAHDRGRLPTLISESNVGRVSVTVPDYGYAKQQLGGPLAITERPRGTRAPIHIRRVVDRRGPGRLGRRRSGRNA